MNQPHAHSTARGHTMLPILLLLMVVPSMPFAAADMPSLAANLGGVELAMRFAPERVAVGQVVEVSLDLTTRGANPAPLAIRTRFGMPEHGHWLDEAQRKLFHGAAITFDSRLPMPGLYRLRIWLEFEDGEENLGVDFAVPGELQPYRVAALPADPDKRRPPRPVTTSQIWTLPALEDGRSVAIGASSEGPTWISFWASWCGPCRQELPQVASLAERWAKAGVRVLAVSVDQDPELAARFLRRVSPGLSSAIDVSGKSFAFFGAEQLPLNVLLDAGGKVVWREEGYREDLIVVADGALARLNADTRGGARPLAGSTNRAGTEHGSAGQPK
ncbi:MAG: TlpA family protein disulfide reductase [Candidatus Schekmanbacteria bacterium]|nr:TlpA family protein disulfide reductase [Candidatus Schekmanbacteria bacterium]